VIPRGRRSWQLGALAKELGLECPREPGLTIEGVAALDDAGAGDLAAVYDPRLAAEARDSRAAALVVPPPLAAELSRRPVLVSERPKADFARAIGLIRPAVRPAPGVDPSAVVAGDARLGERVTVGPGAVVGPRCVLGDDVVVGAGAVLTEEVEVGDAAEIHPRVVIYPLTRIGARATLFAGAVVGAPGFGHARDEAGRALRVPHLGRVVLEEDVEIGANTTIDRATFGETRIGARARLDNLVQIGHNAQVGADAMIAAQSGLSGSSRIGRGVVVGGQSGLADHVTVGDGAAVAAKTAVFADVEPGAVVAGIPAMPMRLWRRLAALQLRLPSLWRALRRLERDET
jgi:UDP-3-O-[3-hydroxymyristoyl] glucosamine N-acyltransferase